MSMSPSPCAAITTLIVNALFAEHPGGAEHHALETTRANSVATASLHRLLWIDPQGEYVATIALPTKHSLPVLRRREDFLAQIEESHWVLATTDPYTPVTLINSTTGTPAIQRRYATASAIREARWKRIQPLVEDPHRAVLFPRLRGGAIAVAAAASKCAPTELYRLLRLFWQFGQTPDALLPQFDRCGARGIARTASTAKRGRPRRLGMMDEDYLGMNVTEDVREIIVDAGRRHYEHRKLSLLAAYEAMLRESFCRIEIVGTDVRHVLYPENERPSFGQFRYWFKARKASPAGLEARVGTRRYNLSHRVALQSSTDRVSGPGSQYQVDATVGDIYLRSSLVEGRIIGRPVIYIVVDAFSRMIVGLHIGLDGPSWLGMMLALENAFSSKVDFCRRFGITIDPALWPCQHLCDRLLGDRGELLSRHGNHVVRSLNIELMNTGSWRADWKGIVERRFRTNNDEVIHWVPGAVHDLRERGSPDYRLDALFTISQFTEVMIKLALDHNNRKLLRGDDAIPLGYPYPASGYPTALDVWNWGIVNRSGHLRAANRDRVRANLLPGGDARITEDGICYQGLYYAPTSLVEPTASCDGEESPPNVATWFLRNTGRAELHVPAAVDPRDVSTLYVRLRDGRDIIPCSLVRGSRRYAGLSSDEVRDAQEILAISNDRSAHDNLNRKIDFKADVDALVTAAEKQRAETGEQPLGPRDVRDIRSTRSKERSALHRTDAWRPQANSLPADGPPSDSVDEPADHPTPGYIAPPTELQLLTGLRLLPPRGASEP